MFGFLKSMLKNFTNTIKVIWHSLPYIWDNNSESYIRFRILYSSFLSFGASALNVATPLLLMKSIDALSEHDRSINIFNLSIPAIVLPITYGLTWTAVQILTQLRIINMERVIQNASTKLSLKLIKQLNSLSVRFHVNRSSGSTVELIEKAQYGINNLIVNGFINIPFIVLEIVASTVVVTINYGLLYGGGLVGILATYSFVTAIASNESTRLQLKANNISQNTISRLNDNLLNYETVKCFNSISHEISRCQEALKERENALVESYKSSDRVILLQSAMIGAGLTVISAISGYYILYKSKYDTGDFILFNTYIAQFVWPLNSIGNFLKEAKRAVIDLRTVFDVIELKPDVTDIPNAKPLALKNKNIIFKNVCFSYDSKEIIKNLSFEIQQGQKVAIVGKSGCGKSTIAKLMFRFYNINSGQILFGGQDINEVEIESLRNHIGLVPQNVVLFDDTLLYNITYGCPHANSEFVKSIIKKCQLDEFINNLPEKENTLVGERGLKISGGERQRIGLARVFIKSPAIYIFDEPTSSLDSETEFYIKKCIENITKDFTTITIAHRLATIKNADKILVIHNGELIEQGTHQELLDKNGFYKKLWLIQTQGEMELSLDSKADSEIINQNNLNEDSNISSEITIDIASNSQAEKADVSTPLISGSRLRHLSIFGNNQKNYDYGTIKEDANQETISNKKRNICTIS